MNKRGIIKLGAGILVLLLVLVLVFSSLFSSAAIKSSYIVGEEFKMDLSQYEPCNLKIKTPSTTLVQSNCDDKFSLKLEEAGDYIIDIKSQDTSERIEFQVYPEQETINEAEENQINISPEENPSLPPKEYIPKLEQSMPESKNDEFIKIGEPVKNKQTLSLEEEQTIKIKIPESAENISLHKDSGEKILFKEKQTIADSIQNVVNGNNEKSLIIQNAQGEIQVEYTTPGPEKTERDISENKKEVTVSSSSDLHYENVLSYTSIPEKLYVGQENLIKVYWKENNTYLDFKAYDKDGNGLLDYIEWIVPHLSNQTFEISIGVLNIQSYPVVGGNWAVEFKTTGKSDLTIKAINGTNFGEGEDLELLELKCGDETVDYQIIDGGFFVSGWECNNTAYEISKVLTNGKHTLEFDFGGMKAYAYNLASKWYNSSWNYRKEIRINGTGTALTNYQERIITNLTDEFNENKINSTCKDVRFTNSIGDEIGFWTESCNVSGGNSIFWVKVPSIPASGNTTIFMYYGNPSVSSNSNGTSTFDFFDDFSGDLSKWTIDSENPDAVNITSGSLMHSPDSSQSKNAYYDTRLRTSSYKMQDGILDYDTYFSGTDRAIHQFGFRVDSLSFNSGYAWRLQSSSADGGFFKFASNTWTAFGTSYPAVSTGVWHHVQINASGSNYYSSVDGGSVYSGSDSTKTTADYLISHVHATGTNYYVLVDNIRVRQYTSSVPNYSVFYEEEPKLDILINYPSNGSNISDVTPTLNITILGLGQAQSVWYTLNGGLTNITLCNNCSGEKTKFLYLAEGNYLLNVYANSTNGTDIFSRSNFTVSMNYNYYDTFDDNSSLLSNQINNLTWNIGNITYSVSGSSYYQSNISLSNAQRVVSSSSFSNRGVATNGTVLFFNNGGTDIKIVSFSGTVISTHTVSNLGADNNQLAYSSKSKLIYARNGANIYAINLSSNSSTLVINANNSTQPYLTGDSWVSGTLIDMPDGRIGTIGSTISNPFTVRIYNVSSNGTMFTWSQDMNISSSWSTDNHGLTSDGRFLTLVSYNTGHRVYDLTTGTQFSSDSWDLRPSGISNPTYVTHDHVNHRYIIADYSDYDFVIYNDSLYTTSPGLTNGNFTSYSINTTSLISKITNITWQEDGTNQNNNLSVEVSADGGNNWYKADKNKELSAINLGYSLAYRVIFNANQSANLSLLDMNISWTSFVEPPSNITINYPNNASTLKDVTPILNVSINGTVSALWYTTNNGVTNTTICTACSGVQTKVLYLKEGNFILKVYDNNSLNVQNKNQTSFTVNMNYSYDDRFGDNSSLLSNQMNNVNWSVGNITYTGSGLALYKSNISLANADVKDPDSAFTLRGIATNGTVLFFNDNGVRIIVTNFNGNVLSTHTISNLASGNNQLAYSKRYIFARNGANIYRVDLTSDTSTLVSVDSSYPLQTGDSWMTGNLFDMPDGRIGTVSSPSSNPFTVRLYTVSSDGLTFTWSRDISIASSWSTDNHGSASSDGRFLTLISYNGGHRVYDLTTGTEYSQDSWNLQPPAVGNPTYIAHDHINHRYIIGDYSDDNFVIYNDSIYNYSMGTGNFTAYSINTTNNITKITNITWDKNGTDSNNNISVQLSIDGGINWYNATKGGDLTPDIQGKSLVYRVLFNAQKDQVVSLLGVSINWTDYSAPPESPPDITMNYPYNVSIIADVTPILNITLNGTANTLWYTIDGFSGINKICNLCTGMQTKILPLKEGNFIVRVYANNSVGTQNTNLTTFIVDMNKNYYDNFYDNSSLLSNKMNNVNWSINNITYFGEPSIIYKPNISLSNVQRVISSSPFNNRGITTNGTVLFFNNGGTNIKVVSFTGTVLSTHTVSNLAAANNQIAYSSKSKLIYARNGVNIYAINLSDDSSTLVTNANTSTKPYPSGDSWMTGNLFDMPDGRIGTVSSPSSNPITIRLYTVSSDGLTFTWSQDVNSAVTWSTDNHGFAADGTFLTFVSMSGGHRVYYISNGTQYYYDSWNLQPSGIANPTFVTHDPVNHRYIVGDYDDYDFVIYNDSIYDYSIGTGNFTAYPINTTQPIKQIINITWREEGTDSNNNISVELSFNNGLNWYNVTKNQGLTGFTPNNSLVYRVLFKVNESRNIKLLDMNISWLEPPSVKIVYPGTYIYNSTITQMNYTLRVAEGESLGSCWYSLNGGNITTPITCGQNITSITSIEGNNTWIVYTNDTNGAIGSDTVKFAVDLSAPNITFINQTDQDELIVNSSHPLEQGQDITIRVNVSDFNIDKVWITVWQTVKNGAEKVKVFFTYLGGFLWVAKLSTNQAWEGVYNYTIYANDTAGYKTEYDNNFSMVALKSTINLIPNPTPGTGSVNVYGLINFTNGSSLVNYPVNLWFNGKLLLTGNLSNGASSWWDPSWGYRKKINVTNNNPTSVLEEGYSFNFTLDTTGNNFLYTGNDLRIVYTNVNGSVELDRINSTAFNSSSTTIWFKIQKNISASSTDSNYYVYYGNPYAGTPPTNKSNVYLFYDGFVNSNAWTASSGICSASNSQGNPMPSLYMAGNGVTDKCYANNFNLPTNFIIEADIFISSGTRGIRNIGFRHDTSNANGYIYRLQTSASDGGFFILNGAGTWSQIGTSDGPYSANAWHNVKLLINGSTFTSWVDGTQKVSVTDATYSNKKIGTQDDGGADLDSYVDNYIVRKYVYPEPSLGLGIEENQSGSSAGTLLSFTDNSSGDFNKGNYYSTFYDGSNLTLSGTNTTGNFTRILDAGARVEWTNVNWGNIGKSCSGTISYQEGDSENFTGTYDTYLDSSTPTTNYGGDNYLLIDSSPLRSLIKFDVLGYGYHKIPFNSVINSANVTLNVYDLGDPVTVYEVLENWSEEQATYNNRLTGTSWGSTGCASIPSRSATTEDSFNPSAIGNYTFSILNAFRRWTNKTSENYGIVLNPGGSGGVGIRSSEYTIQSYRPNLKVSFDSPDCTSVRVFIRTSNDKASWTNWQEVSKGGNINDSNAASRYLEYRVELNSFNQTYKPYLKNITFNYAAILTNSSGWYNTFFNSPTSFGDYSVCVNTSYRTENTGTCSVLQVFSSFAPNVFLISPTDNQWFNYKNLTLIYNVSDRNDDNFNASLFINGLYNKSNSTNITNNQYNNFSINLTQGQYTWTVNVTDMANNSNIAIERTFYIDLENPNVSLIYPGNQSSLAVSQLNLSFNTTDNMDTNLTCSVVLDGITIRSGVGAGNGNITNISSGILGSGTHYWNVTCTDNAIRNFTSSTFNFNISDTPPNVTLVSPNPNYLVGNENISFIYNASDNSGLINCSLYLDRVFNVTNQTAILNNQNNSINVTGINEGKHNWTVECFDLSASPNKPSPRNFSVDLYFPTIALNLPGNNTVTNYSNVNFNFTANDSFDLSLNCNLTINGIIVDNNFTANSGQLTNRPINNLTDGIKYWNVSCTDDAGHVNSSLTRLINIREPPMVILNTSNESAYKVNYITLDYTPYDNTNLSQCSLYLDGVFNKSNSSAINKAQLNSFVVNNLKDGTHLWYVNCSDLINLFSVSETRVFYIDSNPPNITLYHPNGENVFSKNITFNFTVIDNVDSNLICNLTVDNTVQNRSFVANNNSVTNITVSGLYDGYHTWFVNCSDDAGNIGGSLIFNLTRVTTPAVILVWPNNNYWFNSPNISLIYRPDNDQGLKNSSLFINGILNQTNTTEIINHGNNTFNVSGIIDGGYNWTVNVTGINGLLGATTERQFYVDTHPPEERLYEPDGTKVIETNNVTFNFSTIDNLDSAVQCNITLDGDVEFTGNVNNNSNKIVYILLVDGNHTWSVTCMDEAGNINVSGAINFTVKAPPNVTLNSPSEGFRTKNSAITFFYTPSDAIGIINCSLYIDGKINKTDNGPIPNIQNNFSVIGIDEGKHNWTVNCTDPDNNWNWSAERNFYRDISPPSISLELPDNNSGMDYNKDRVYFNWTAIDALDTMLQCNLTVDGVVRVLNEWVTGNISTSKYVFTSVIGQGQHSWNVTCWDQLKNSNTSELRKFNLTYPDFFVNFSDIILNETNLKENQSVKINAIVYNLAGADTQNVTVRFYNGDPDSGGTIIGTNLFIDLSKYNQTNVTTNWLVPIGASQIFVIVDPPLATNGSFKESNESNNKASKNFNVGSWQFFYGDVLAFSDAVLANSNSSKLISWAGNGFVGGNVYVANYDSYVSWSSLQAIGKAKNNTVSSSDFAEIDSALNSSSYADSVYSVYTNSGTPKTKLSLSSFGNIIQDVPVVNSTNNSNFVTGILWDTSDDISGGEFDSTDKEDIVFVAPLNKNTLGTYGTYDYEMRVPAKLRSYKSGNSNAVSFYVELS